MKLQNKLLRVFILLLFINSNNLKLNAQECIDYPDIIGDACENCAPPGWGETNIGQTYVHIMVPVNGPLPSTNCTLFDVSGPSPSGGNVVILQGSQDYFTTIFTTISGLDTDVTYTFGMYWEEVTLNCTPNNNNGGPLHITIDGEVFEFTGATEWELAEACFTPTSSSVEVIISTPQVIPGHTIIIDGNPNCALLSPCCLLDLIVDQDFYSVCPEETIVLEAEYQDEIGFVQVEWACDPPEGLNYLSATDVISPEFTFPEPNSDYLGETFKYSLTIEDSDCAVVYECIEVEVRSSIIPEFDVELCNLDLIAELPTESIDGFTGSWSGDFDIEFSGGTTVSYLFTLDSGQDNCLESYEYDFPVEEGVITNFSIEEVYCLSDNNYYFLPSESLEFVEGIWTPTDEFNPSELGQGTYTYTFLPDDNYCASIYELNINVVLGSSPNFDLPQQFCAEESYFVLPQISLDGVSGTWSMDSIDLSIPVQNGVAVFTPDENDECYGGFNYNYSVEESEVPLFDLPQSICREDIIISFDPISTQNISGTWTPSEFNPDTVSTAITAIWTPENQDDCILSLEVTIPIIDKAEIDLDLPDTLCAGDMTYILPEIDSIAGSWNMDVIDLTSNIGSTIIVEYIVDEDQCYLDFADTIFVTSLEIPQFSISESYCSNGSDILLPETSDDSVQGSWNINPVDPSMQDSLVIVFTPNSAGCYDLYSQTLYFTEIINPTFDIPSYVCEDEAIFTFPSVSENGISGTWTESTLDPSMEDQSIFNNTFTPDDPSCASSALISIQILSFENVSLFITNPTSCEAEDGTIQFIDTSEEMQLSIDDGITWTPVTDIENLASGSYSLQLRFESLPSCNLVITPQLNSVDSPIIEDIITNAPSACDQEDGSIECNASGNDLEYSIDGATWQASNIFENLAAANYVIYVREAGFIDCVSSVSVEIVAPIVDEICDGIDNNCNGEIDEGFATENYFADKDMDGYGDPNDMINSCVQPQGYVLDNKDCDDDNDEIFPGADETPDNGIDEDCDGTDLTTSVHELAGQKIDIYPNPTNGFVTIELQESSDIRLSLYDMNGRCLIQEGKVNTLDLSEYTNGVYLIKITDSNTLESIVERVILYK